MLAEWSPFGKELLIWLTVCSLCIMSIIAISQASIIFQKRLPDAVTSLDRPCIALNTVH